MPAAIAKRLREVVLLQWRELLLQRRNVLRSFDIDAIHDLRVASRRFRAALAIFEAWLPQRNTAPLNKNIRRLTRVLGHLRNIDEALLFFRLHTPAEAVRSYQFRYLLAQMRSAEMAKIKAVLNDFDHRRLGRLAWKMAARLEEQQSASIISAPLAAVLPAICTRLYQPIHELLPAATSSEQRQARHALRIAIKKWRYFFEIAGPVLQRDYSAILGQLKEYQTILGRMNDVIEFAALCGALPLCRHERLFIEATLRTEDDLLLQELSSLIKQKPLACISLL